MYVLFKRRFVQKIRQDACLRRDHLRRSSVLQYSDPNTVLLPCTQEHSPRTWRQLYPEVYVLGFWWNKAGFDSTWRGIPQTSDQLRTRLWRGLEPTVIHCRTECPDVRLLCWKLHWSNLHSEVKSCWIIDFRMERFTIWDQTFENKMM